MKIEIVKDIKDRTYVRILTITDWTDFETFTTRLTKRLQGKIMGKYDTALSRAWEVLFGEEIMIFSINDYNALTIRAKRMHGAEQLKMIVQRIRNL